MVAFARQDIKDHADCQDFYLSEVGTGKRAGRAIVDRTPWRDDRKPSLNIYPDGWVDRATGERGDIFSLAGRLHNIPDFARQLEHVAAYLGATPEHQRLPIVQRAAAPAQHEPPSTGWQRTLDTIVKSAQATLRTPAGAHYLNWLHGRGLSDATIDAAQLGYNAGWINVTVDGKPIKIGPGLLIPYHVGGVLWAVQNRTDKGDPKYIYVTGSKPTLYNADAIQPGKPLIVFETALDALLVQQEAGDLVAPLATGSAMNKVQGHHHAAFEAAPLVILAQDNDDAGRQAAESNAAGLPDGRIVAVTPAGKDVTEFAQQGGNVRTWIAEALTQPAPVQSVSDGIRSAMLNCKLDPALIVCELASLAGVKPGQEINKPDLKAANERLGLGINDRLIDRGVDQVAEQFSTKSRTDPNQLEDVRELSNLEFVENTTGRRSAGRPEDCCTLPTVNTIKATLRALLPWRLLERMYPSWRDSFPEQKVAELVAAIDGLTADEQAALIDELIQYCRVQAKDEIKVRGRWKAYREALSTLLRMLVDAHSTPLPSGWVNGRQYRAIYLHELVKADQDARRGYDDIALLTGINPSNVKPLLDRAALDNHTEPELIPLPERGKVAAAARRAATGRGKIYEVVTLDAQGRETTCQPFDEYTVQAWADSAPASATLAIRLRVKGRQTVAGEVQPPAPRQSKPAPAEKVPESDTQPKTGPIGLKRQPRPTYLGVGPDPLRLRDFLLDVYEDKKGETLARAVRDCLTVQDAARMVILRAEDEMFATLSHPEVEERTGALPDILLKYSITPETSIERLHHLAWEAYYAGDVDAFRAALDDDMRAALDAYDKAYSEGRTA